MIKIPGIYAGEDEIRYYCKAREIDNVFIVTYEGELRKVTKEGPEALCKVSEVGKELFKKEIKGRLKKNIVLFKSKNHWERIEGVNDK